MIKIGELSHARQTELRSKIEAAIKQQLETFGTEMSVDQVLVLMKRHLIQQKEAVIMKTIGIISEADIQWLESTRGAIKSKTTGSLDSGETKSKKGSSDVQERKE